MPRPLVSIRLFGRLEVQVDNRHLVGRDLGGLKPKRLLEILALARGAPVSKDRLVDILWNGEAPADVLGGLESHASLLRSRLGLPHPGPIIADSETYSMVLPPGAIDLDRFDRHLQAADNLAADSIAARPHLEAAIVLAAETLLADEPYAEWVIPIRERYAALVHDASLALADYALAEGDPAVAATWAEYALARDRLSERAVRTVMRAWWSLGRQHEALLVYKRAIKALREVLRVAPMEETLRLAAAIWRHDSVEVERFSEDAPALVVPPPAYDIPGTRLGDVLDWLPMATASNSRRCRRRAQA